LLLLNVLAVQQTRLDSPIADTWRNDALHIAAHLKEQITIATRLTFVQITYLNSVIMPDEEPSDSSDDDDSDGAEDDGDASATAPDEQ
jgi:hypothetical protein